MTLERLLEILHEAGFVGISVDAQVVSDEYAGKWGVDLDLKRYLRNGTITAKKPESAI